jgi:integrase/recombinase XerC
MKRELAFHKAVKSFEKYLIAERGYSKLTVKHYKHDLSMLGRYLEENFDYKLDKLKVKEINQYEVSEFLSDIILVKDNSPAAKNR